MPAKDSPRPAVPSGRRKKDDPTDTRVRQPASSRRSTDIPASTPPLPDSAASYRTLFEQSMDAIYVASPAGVILEANRAWLQMFGYSLEDIPSLRAVDAYAVAADREVFLQRIAPTGLLRDTVRFKRKDGTTFECERTVFALKDEAGAIVAYEGILRDITERQRAEEELRRSEAYVTAILDNLPVGVAVNSADPAVTFQYMNDNFTRFYRTTRDKLASPDAFWEAVYEEPALRENIRKRVLDDCASSDPGRMHWDDLPITRKGERTTFISAQNVPIPEKGLMLSTVWDVTARMEAEEALRKSEERFRSLFDHSIDAIFIATAEGAILEANQAWLDMFQYSREDMSSLNVLDVYANPAERESLLSRMAESDSVRDEVRYKRKDGTLFVTRRTVVALRDQSGAVVLYQGILYDISELKQAEEREKQQRIFSEALMETSPACILVFHVHRKVVFANAETDRVLGLPPDKIVGMTCGEELRLLDGTGTTLPEGELPVCRVFLNEQPLYATEYAFDSPTGRRILSFSAAPLYDETDAVARVVATVEDVTASKLREQALRESEARYRSLFEQSVDAVALVAVDGTVLEANPAFLKLFKVDSIAGFNAADHYVAPDSRQSFKERMEKEGQLLDDEQVLSRSDGSLMTCLRSAVSRRDVDGRIVGYQTVLHDITERKQREREREESLERLQKAMHATVEAMSAAVEMRDPYTAGHQRRVTTVARAIAGELGVDGDSLQALTLGGQLHDLGKLHIPAEILSKPRALTKSEFMLIKEHAQASYDLLKGIDFPWPVADIAYQHHERLDGSGYPRGLKGDEMLPEARILAVADVFEAMSSHRPYRPSLGPEAALAELLAHRGTLYDPDAVDACVRIVREKGFILD